jgi:hypothetical protein
MKTVNTGMTMVDVRLEAMDTIRLLKEKQIDVKTAAEIRNQCNVVIDVAKTQVEYLKAIPNSIKEQLTPDEVKAMAGTLTDRDAELDMTLKEIGISQSRPYPKR